jgi:hypothetical protein
MVTLLTKIIRAIHKINPNAGVTMSGNTIDELEIEWLNGTTPILKADIVAMLPTVEAEIEQEKQDAIAKKASGKQKLLDLGLSEEEVKALIGV